MLKTILIKIGSFLLTLLVVSFIVFSAFEIIPGDPAVHQLGSEATESAVKALRHEMGLDRPFFVRYGEWLISCVSGDMGTSYHYHMPVSTMIVDKLPITIAMTAMSMLMTIVFSVPVALLLAKYARRRLDKVAYVVNQFAMAIPAFFIGILMTYFFGMILKIFTPGGYVSYDKDPGGFFYYLFFPSLAIAIPKCAMSVKLLRSSILTEAKKDYVRTAYSRGNSTMEVLYRHVLKNAMIPLITFWGMAVADSIAGGIVVEQVFNIPGLGRILLSSISSRDYPVVEAVILLIAIVVIVMNLIVDILYHVIDPRIREKES